MNKRRLVCIVLSLCAIFSTMMIRDSAAWLNTKSGEPINQVVTINNMMFAFEGKLDSFYKTSATDDYIVPGQNLIIDNEGRIGGCNFSTIPTDVRFRIKYTRPDGSEDFYRGESDEILDAVIDTDEWELEYWEGFYTKQFTAEEQGPFVAIDKLSFSETKDFTTRDYHGTITIIFQAKQTKGMDWGDVYYTTLEL